MQKFIYIFLLFLNVSFIFVNANEENDHWPYYMKKCERNASNFNSCLFYHANIALRYILHGDDNLGIPNFIPLRLDDFSLGTNQTFMFHLSNVKVFGLNYLDVYNMRWDFDNNNIFIEFHFTNTLRLSAKLFANGTYENNTLPTKIGSLDFVYGDGAITYNMTYKTRMHNGMNYATIDTCQVTRNNTYTRYRLHNALKDRHAEEEFSDVEDKKIDKALDFDLDGLICYIVNMAFRPLFYNFPINLMFD